MKLDIVAKEKKHLCAICQSTSSVEVAKMIDVPLFLGCTARPLEEDKFVSYSISECQHCGLLETNAHLTNDSYEELHSEALGDKWRRHHHSFATFADANLNHYANGDQHVFQILEIGPSSNPISRLMKKQSKHVVYCDILQELPFHLESHETYVRGVFPLIKIDGKFDMIIASHVFEHANNASDFFISALETLHKHGKLVISIPDFQHWISHNYWNAITPEHSIYPFVDHLKLLAQQYQAKMSFRAFENHSLFFSFSREKYGLLHEYDSLHGKSTANPLTSCHQLTSFNPVVGSWCQSILESIARVEKKIRVFPQGTMAFIAGASHLSQYPLLMSPIIQNSVHYTLDNSHYKENKRLYGTSIVSKKFDFIREFNKPIIIVFSSPYQKEMIDQIKSLNAAALIITD